MPGRPGRGAGGAPDRNILSTSFVGVDVIDDSTHGRIRLTTDFGKPR